MIFQHLSIRQLTVLLIIGILGVLGALAFELPKTKKPSVVKMKGIK